MSARRVVACCAVLAVVLVSASWYAVQAFPLLAAQTQVDEFRSEPGPVELRAKPITPENPIPRRTRSVPADYPSNAEAAGLKGKITVRLALDESGHVAESRVVGFNFNLTDGSHYSLAAGTRAWQSTGRAASAQTSESLVPLVRSLAQSALSAVNQWQYAAPADGPITFVTDVWFGVPPPPPPPPPAPRAAPRPGMPPPPPPPPPPGQDVDRPSNFDFAEGALRIGGSIKAPRKIRHVSPDYPAEALNNKVQGVVILEARIEADGAVSRSRVLRSVSPEIDDAAVAAVNQWEFEPVLVDGVASPVMMTVTVNFSLQ